MFPIKIGVASPTPEKFLNGVGLWQGQKPIPSQSIADLYLRSFDALVFSTEFQGPYPFIHKANRDIKIWTLGTNKGEVGRALKIIASQVETATGLRISSAISFDDANIIVSVATKIGISSHCKVTTRDNRDGSLYRAIIQISPEYSGERLVNCLLEELTQSLGPSNDVDIVPESIWRPLEKKTFERLTWHDAIILRTLYDERLKPGMHRDQAMPLVRQIIREVLEDINR